LRSSRSVHWDQQVPQGIIYEDKYKRNKLMHTDELYKFNDGTLTSVRTKEVSHHDQGYRSVAARKKVNEELGKVHWWERLRGRPQTA
ncbi:hypothetical protein Tco_0474783, partial [Tanacetum coccineum]